MMNIKQIVCLLAATSAATAHVLSSRDSNQVQSDLTTVAVDLRNTTTTVNSLNSSQSVTFLKFISDTTKLIEDTQKLGNDTQASASLSACTVHLNYVDRQLNNPDLKNFIDASIAKKSTIAAAGFRNEYVNRLRRIQTALVNALNALCAKCSASSCPGSVTTARNQVQRGIDALLA